MNKKDPKISLTATQTTSIIKIITAYTTSICLKWQCCEEWFNKRGSQIHPQVKA